MSTELDLNDAQWQALLAELQQQPREPDSHFVRTDDIDEFVDYVDETLPAARLATLDAHLDGCPTCTERLAGLFDGIEEWLGPHSRRAEALSDRVKEAQLRAIRGHSSDAEESVPEGAAASFVLHAVQVTARGGKGRRPAGTLDYQLQEDARGGLVLRLVTTDPNWIVGPVHGDFGKIGSGERPADVWLMLHEDPESPGTLTGSVRLESSLRALVERNAHFHVPRVDPSVPETVEALYRALETAATDADREALQEWLEDNLPRG
jgi:hypothetical protein